MQSEPQPQPHGEGFGKTASESNTAAICKLSSLYSATTMASMNRPPTRQVSHVWAKPVRRTRAVKRIRVEPATRKTINVCSLKATAVSEFVAMYLRGLYISFFGSA